VKFAPTVLEDSCHARSFDSSLGPARVDDYTDLRPARQAKNITLAVVANHFGVPIITVSRLERGHQRNDDLATNYRRWLTAA
jgi:transposase